MFVLIFFLRFFYDSFSFCLLHVVEYPIEIVLADQLRARLETRHSVFTSLIIFIFIVIFDEFKQFILFVTFLDKRCFVRFLIRFDNRFAHEFRVQWLNSVIHWLQRERFIDLTSSQHINLLIFPFAESWLLA